MKRWWRRHRHWLTILLIVLVVLAAAAGSALVMRGLMALAGFALNLSTMAAFMIVQVVFYFGFIFYYLGGVKMVKIMPGEAGEVTLEDDYWGQPELVKVARQWVSLLEEPDRLRAMGGQPWEPERPNTRALKGREKPPRAAALAGLGGTRDPHTQGVALGC